MCDKHDKQGVLAIVDAEKVVKTDTLKLYEMLKNSEVANATARTLDVVKSCGDVVKYAIAYEGDMKSVKHKKLLYTETCGNRWCLRCMQRKALSDALEIYTLANYLYTEKNYRFLFITLTAPNCSGDDLRDTISQFNKGIDRLFKREPYRSDFKAWITKVETTYNVKRKDYHPHLHVLVAVDKRYLKDSDRFVSNDRLRKDWREVFGDDTITQVDIKKASGDTKRKRMKSVLELAKYTAKPSHYLRDQKVFDTFFDAMKNRQALRFCGELSELHKMYDLDCYGLLAKWSLFADTDAVEYTHKLLLKWSGKDYNHDVTELTDAEKELLKQKTEYETDKEFVVTYNYNVEKRDDIKKRVASCDEKSAKSWKAKLSKVNRELKIMDMMKDDFRDYFQRKEMSDDDFHKALLIRVD